jgi:hypothetical protein
MIERVTKIAGNQRLFPAFPPKGGIGGSVVRRQLGSAFHTSLDADSCLIGTSSSYVTNKHDNCGKFSGESLK